MLNRARVGRSRSPQARVRRWVANYRSVQAQGLLPVQTEVPSPYVVVQAISLMVAMWRYAAEVVKAAAAALFH